MWGCRQQKSRECQADEAKEIVWQAEEKWGKGAGKTGARRERDYRAQYRRRQGLACGCACELWGVGRWWYVSQARRGCENSLFPGSLPHLAQVGGGRAGLDGALRRVESEDV